MEPERWRRVEELLHAALELPAAQRQAFLEEACGDDAALAAEVESLIRADEHAGAFLGQPLLEDADGVAGRRIGPYRLERKLGEGGMSAVYLAQRDDDQYRRQVAIKLMRFGMDSEDQLRRFRAERQILAELEHPNIARLYDGGTTEEGLPYLVMEVVEGEPIDAWCDRHRLTVRQRLELFRTVCAAVRTAHGHLVVHRDLKPSNILVTAGGVPKLLDFGIAKLLDPRRAPSEVEPTARWLRVMTPSYASPEQVRGGAITTASDVYSLGVLLYRLLTGRLPHRMVDRTPEEIERLLAEREAEKPSVAVARGADRQIARSRGVSPKELARQLAGELDNVVTTALHREPERRYGSAEQLAEDLRRHLVGLPVTAHPDSFGYRAGKFLRRHRVGVVVTAAFVAVVTAAAVLLGLQSARVVRERDEAQRERDKARRVAAFLEGVFEASDPGQSQGEAPTARQILDRGAERIDEAGQGSDVQAALMNTLGRIYRKLGAYERSEELLIDALAIRREVLGPAHPEVAESLRDLGQLHYVRGSYAEAEKWLRESLELRRGADAAVVLVDLAAARHGQGDLEEAEALYLEALERLRAVPGEEPPEVAEAKHNLAVLRHAQGDYASAAELFGEALATWRVTLGEAHPSTAMAVNNLAAVRLTLGDYDGAIAGFREALALQRQVLGDEHPDVAQSVNNLGSLLYLQGRYAEAEPLFRESSALRQRLLGEENPAVAQSFNNLGALLRDRGELEEAEPLLRRAVALWRQALGDEHPAAAGGLTNLALLLLARGEHAEAEPLLREALRLRRELLGAEHPAVAHTLVGLGRLLTAIGELEEAELLLREAVAIRRDKLPPEHWHTASAESALGGCLTALGRLDEAEPLLLAGYQRLAGQRPAEDGEVARARRRLGALYDAWGRPGKAAAYR